MINDTVQQLFQIIATAVIAAAATGGIFWKIIEKAIDKKFAIEQHRQNTVFSRVDLRRAEAVIDLNGQLRNYMLRLSYFSPKITFQTYPAENSALSDAVVWCLEMQQDVKNIIESQSKLQLFLPKFFPENFFIWYLLENDNITNLANIFMQLGQTEEFKSLSDSEKRTLLNSKKTDFYKNPNPAHTFVIARRIYDDIERIFHSVGDIPPMEPLPPLPNAREMPI